MSICRVCGGAMEPRVTDLPLKIGDSAVVIVKEVPVPQMCTMRGVEIEQQIVVKVEKLLASVDRSAELEVIPYAAGTDKPAIQYHEKARPAGVTQW